MLDEEGLTEETQQTADVAGWASWFLWLIPVAGLVVDLRKLPQVSSTPKSLPGK